jgi:hypothetical protein
MNELAPDLWHATHSFISMGLPATSRMTVARCADGSLWLHSPITMTPALKQAQLWGAPGLRAKRPDLVELKELPAPDQAPWKAELDALFIPGIPLLNETVWFHHASGTLIITDLCMWFTQAQSWRTRLYGHVNGVMDGLAVSRLVRLLARDKTAVAHACQKILQWPIQRVVVAHDCVLETNAKQHLADALAYFKAG